MGWSGRWAVLESGVPVGLRGGVGGWPCSCYLWGVFGRWMFFFLVTGDGGWLVWTGKRRAELEVGGDGERHA